MRLKELNHLVKLTKWLSSFNLIHSAASCPSYKGTRGLLPRVPQGDILKLTVFLKIHKNNRHDQYACFNKPALNLTY